MAHTHTGTREAKATPGPPQLILRGGYWEEVVVVVVWGISVATVLQLQTFLHHLGLQDIIIGVAIFMSYNSKLVLICLY